MSNNFNLIHVDRDASTESIYSNMEQIFNEAGRLLVLLDTTLDPHGFDDLKGNLDEENIIYIPLAVGNNSKNTHLFFLDITKKEILEKIGKELAEKISHNFEISNDRYVVHGFGVSNLDHTKINQYFKKSLVVQDLNSKILFRWYDPRVMIYLDEIFTETQLNSLFGMFEAWNFTHPTGYFSWKKDNQQKFLKQTIHKLTHEQSIALDLIEISNLVYQQANNHENIDADKVKPKNILENLYFALQDYKLEQYADLYSYGMYAEILGRNFFIHPEVEKIIKKYWKVEPNNYDFNESMNFVDEESWPLIRNDLNLLESMPNG